MSAADDLAVMKDAWAALCAVAGVTRYDLTFQLIELAYTAPGRRYHNARHIADCLGKLEAVRPMFADALAASAALLFHDYVYDPARGDNEEASADEAGMALHAVGWPTPRVEVARGLILATRHAAPPATPDAALVADIDLSILGAPPDEFARYEAAIRREYAHVPDDAYRAGRASVLHGFLARPRIYATNHFASRCESTARQNLGRSLSLLT